MGTETERTFTKRSQQSSSKETFLVCRLYDKDLEIKYNWPFHTICTETDDSRKLLTLDYRVITYTCTHVPMRLPHVNVPKLQTALLKVRS